MLLYSFSAVNVISHVFLSPNETIQVIHLKKKTYNETPRSFIEYDAPDLILNIVPLYHDFYEHRCD
jgi:hypothetical protein